MRTLATRRALTRALALRPSIAGRARALRRGERKELELTAGTQKQLVPVHQYGELPEYYMYAGLVFSPLVQPMLHDWSPNDWYNQAPRKLVEKALHAPLDKEGKQVVVLCQVLQDEANAGYESFTGLMVEAINGTPIDNLQHLALLLRGSTDEFVTVELEDSRFVALRTSTAAQATERIQQRHRIARPSWLRAEDGAADEVGASLDNEPRVNRIAAGG